MQRPADQRVQFFNTTNEPDDILDQYRREAGKQDRAVIEFFGVITEASPSQCHQMLTASGVLDDSVPLTSIRRSISSLTNRGVLVKTETKVVGAFGRPEYCWRMASPKPVQLTLLLGGKP